MATSKIEKSVKTSVSINEVDFTSSTSLAYTGVSITIKANTPFILLAQAVYDTSPPEEIYLSFSSTSIDTFAKVAGGALGFASLCGIFPNGITLYIWARYVTARSNKIRHRLIYFE